MLLWMFQGLDTVSDYAITFHYISVENMYNLEYFVYHLKPYGVLSGVQDLNRKGADKLIPPAHHALDKDETEKKTEEEEDGPEQTQEDTHKDTEENMLEDTHKDTVEKILEDTPEVKEEEQKDQSPAR